MMNPPLSDLGGEHRTEPVPPISHRLVADIDATLVQQRFEPTVRKAHNGFRDRPVRPLRHPSNRPETAIKTF